MTRGIHGTAPQRLGRNAGKYNGDVINIAEVLADVQSMAKKHGWDVQTLLAADPAPLFALRRCVDRPEVRLYVSAGIHGDEPAGPLAIRELLFQDAWPSCADIWLCPCLNPAGFTLSTRECAGGLDLNRDYRHLRSREIRAHVAWLEQQPRFDVSLCLHEDWEAHGFYVYELNPDGRPSLADRIVDAVRPVCPIDPSALIDGRDANAGIIRPNLDPVLRPDWPEAFYLITHKTRLSYTMESPSDFPMPVRTAALAAATNAAVCGVCSTASDARAQRGANRQ